MVGILTLPKKATPGDLVVGCLTGFFKLFIPLQDLELLTIYSFF